jgi:hypothetical protein
VFDRELLQNDLQQPALMLSAGILDGLARARVRGSDWVFLSGSGPTVGARGVRGCRAGGGAGRRDRAGAGGGGVPAPARPRRDLGPSGGSGVRPSLDGGRGELSPRHPRASQSRGEIG